MSSPKETTTPLAARLTAFLWPIPRARWGLCFLPMTLVIALTPPAWLYASRFTYRVVGCFLPARISVVLQTDDGSLRVGAGSPDLAIGEVNVGSAISPPNWDDSDLVPYPMRNLRQHKVWFDVSHDAAAVTSAQWEQLAISLWNDNFGNMEPIQATFASCERDQSSLHVVVDTVIGPGDFIWRNLLRNLFWWTTTLGWIWSFIWLLRCPPWRFAAVRAQARRDRNLCPHCSYPHRGLPVSSARCPECGEPISPPAPVA